MMQELIRAATIVALKQVDPLKIASRLCSLYPDCQSI